MSRFSGLDIIVRETASIPRQNEPVRVGVPVPYGTLRPEERLVICPPEDPPRPCQVRVLKTWKDGSVKWLLVDFLATVSADSCTAWRLVLDQKLSVEVKPILIKQYLTEWTVDTGAGVFHIDTQTLRPFKQVFSREGEPLTSSPAICKLHLTDRDAAQATIAETLLEENGPLRAVVRLKGYFAGTVLGFSCRLHFKTESLCVRTEMTIHNPRPTQHPQGLWDLGDNGSFFFDGLSFLFPYDNASGEKTKCIPDLSGDVSGGDFTTICISQESSGGEHWQSPNHRNRKGEVPFSHQGYRLEVDGELRNGLRAEPQLWRANEQQGIAVVVPRFWQEFPKQLNATERELEVELFPASFPDEYELQGGERKTHEFYIDYSSDPEGLRWALRPLAVMAAPAAFHDAGIISGLPFEEDLVDRFVSAEDMLAKREPIDEYGWRNFGDVYADHEAVQHRGEEPFVSHYNNQYDLLAGVYRKAFATGDFDWLVFAADLARHVLDIDIYHTNGDREEYNYGLFWHTDHYAPAGLSTHRSYSNEQQAAYEMHTGGGGPGAEHCYAAGLALHYFLTGVPDFKEAVIRLSEWGLLALKGPQTLLAALKRCVDNLKLWRVSSGETVLFPAYPLTRGTGNVIATCLEAFEVSGDTKWLKHIAEILEKTLHAGDDIEARKLLDAERSWSYTVLLVSVVMYLDKKRELNQLDGSFRHTRNSLLHYAEWMATHEYPYLDKPEILEYPNETWAAQDLRKSVIFYHAARYSLNEEQRERFQERAKFFYYYSVAELQKHGSSCFTRPVALILQNGWVGAKLQKPINRIIIPADMSNMPGKPIPKLCFWQVVLRLGWDLQSVVKQTSMSREWAWLKSRL